MTTRILVCGGRDFADKLLLYAALDRITPRTAPDEYGNDMPADLTIIHGAARGADQLADDWAVINWCNIEAFPADWERFGRAAGHRRNAEMLKQGRPDIVVAFPGGRGTAGMVAMARKAGVPVIEPRWCGHSANTGLPGGACENCMNTGVLT